MAGRMWFYIGVQDGLGEKVTLSEDVKEVRKGGSNVDEGEEHPADGTGGIKATVGHVPGVCLRDSEEAAVSGGE